MPGGEVGFDCDGKVTFETTAFPPAGEGAEGSGPVFDLADDAIFFSVDIGGSLDPRIDGRALL